MLINENILKIFDINSANSIIDILRDNPIVRSYDKIQHIVILDFKDSIQFYLHVIRDEI